MLIIIRSKFFFLFIGREPITWPANNCLQLMVCSCAMLSNNVWLQIIFCPCVKETVADCFTSQWYSLKKQTWWSNDKTIIELGYRKISWFVSVPQTMQLFDLLTTDKSRYFAQPRPIILLNILHVHGPISRGT